MRHSWKTTREHQTHADDWLMTYADMITLLLCFFAIVVSVTLNKKETPQTPVPVAQSLPVTMPDPVPPPAQALWLHPAELAPMPEPMQGNLPFRSETHDDVAEPEIPQPGAAVPEPVAAPLQFSPPVAALADIIADLKPQPAPVEAPKGDRITMLEMNSAAFFDSGSASLSVAGKTILHDVAAKLTTAKFDGYQITVEGHTDDTPIKTAQFPSNWELSTARASAVLHFLLQEGIPATKLRAAGYADTFAKLPNRDAAGKAIPENQAQNRRVVIKLEKIDRE